MKDLILTTALCISINYQPTKVIFDVPALKGKSFVEIVKILGKPKLNDVPTDLQTRSGVTGDAFFEKNGFTLEVTYNPVNNHVNDFFIGKAHAVSDYKMLEAAANVLNAKGFILSPVNSNKEPSKYAGVTITPR